MSSADEQLPEGTDSIIEGAGLGDESADENVQALNTADDEPANASGTGESGTSEGVRGAFFDKVDDMRGQATDKARDFAQSGKDRATAALDGLVQTVEDAAAEIDDKLGSQYGDYARRAAAGIGNFSDSFRDKDVDALFADARALIAKSPAVAVGAAAAIGFVVARLARAGVADAGPTKDAPEA